MSEQESENPHFKLIHDRLDAILTWGVVIFLVLLLVGVATPNMLVNPKKSQHQKDVQFAKQWGYALFNFENDFGMYPNDETAEVLKKEYPDKAHLLKTESSNDYLRQLVVAGYIDGGEVVEMLDSDEFPFTYVSGLNSACESSLPLLISAFERGRAKVDEKYAKKHYNKRIVVLRIDMSVTDRRLDDDYFDWSQPHWGGQKPKIVWPE